MQSLLDEMVDISMEDAAAEMEFESRWQAIDKCRSFLNSLVDKKIQLSLLGEVTE